MLQVRAVAFHHQYAKNLVVNMALDERGCARQHFVEIERGIYLFAYLRERGQHFGRKLRRGAGSERICVCFRRIHASEYYSRADWRARRTTLVRCENEVKQAFSL